MKLWTMQPVEVYEILMKDGVFVCDETKIPEPSFKESYDWLNKHLEKKDAKPSSVKYPIWAWFRFDNKEKKPDLRHACYGNRGEKMVCLELEIPDEKVLLSDFDLWHFVLNKWWLYDCFYPDYGEDDYEKSQQWFKTLDSDKQNLEKEKSWERIFDIVPFENDWISKGTYVQAIFWELKKENVKKIQFFTAR